VYVEQHREEGKQRSGGKWRRRGRHPLPEELGRRADQEAAGVVRHLRWLRRCVDVSGGQKINDVVCGVRRKGAVRCAEVATSRKIDGNVDTLHVEEIGINDLWWIMSLDLTLYEIYCISIVVKGIIVQALYSRSLFLSAGLEEIMPDK
jgi:hypothetical protein